MIGFAGVAAHDALDALDVQAGETVLIAGATGGVSIALLLAVATIGQIMRAAGTVASTLGATPEQLGRDDVGLAGIMAAATADKL